LGFWQRSLIGMVVSGALFSMTRVAPGHEEQ